MGFTSFVILAEMRTGSNFLEASLNSFEGISSYGELFNPHFVGQHNKDALFGISLDQREADPFSLLGAIREKTDGLAGFRLFSDHDPRVLEYVLAEPSCAKIVLTRNPLESYISLKIAAETGQWKLSDLQKRKDAKVGFDLKEFQDHLDTQRQFQSDINAVLQRTGQAAFHIRYEDVGEVEILNGLARFLGAPDQIKSVSNKTKKQNPGRLEDKVSNFSEMTQLLASFDLFGLDQPLDFEHSRGSAVPSYVAGSEVPLLYLPIANGLEGAVEHWLAALDGVSTDDLTRGLSQKSLRRWKKDRPGHRSFTVVRHPMSRAYDALCMIVMSESNVGFDKTRHVLAKRYGVEAPDPVDQAAVKACFSKFLTVLKGGLAGQTSLRIDANWATQSSALTGFSTIQPPDYVIREDDIARDLERLAQDIGAEPQGWVLPDVGQPFDLKELYDAHLERQCFQAYRKDYINFGFSSWL
ncbi:MAG: nodulation protein NodH [Pseudomonadota bacterium]